MKTHILNKSPEDFNKAVKINNFQKYDSSEYL